MAGLARKYLGALPEDDVEEAPVVRAAQRYLGLPPDDEQDAPLAPGTITFGEPTQPQTGILEGLGKGFMRGARDVGETIGKGEVAAGQATMGMIDPETVDMMNSMRENENKLFDKQYGDSTSASVGRIGGQLVAAEPMVATAMGALPAALPAAAGIIGGNMLLRGGAFLGRGAAEGAGGNLLTGADPVEGATYGAAFAPLTKLASSVGGKAIEGLHNLVSSDASIAARKVKEALTRDGLDPETVSNRLSEMGPNATIMDIGGTNTKNLADAAANRPGKAAAEIYDFLNTRHSEQGDRILSAASKGLKTGPNVDYHGAVDELVAKRKADSGPAYAKAHSFGTVNNDRIAEFVKDPEVQAGIKKGLRLERIEALKEGRPFNPTDYGVTGFNEAGDPILGKVPNMKLLDAGKQGLDAMIQENTDITGKMNKLGAALTGLKDSYLKEIDAINPDYAKARAAYSGPSQSMDAVKSGKDFIKNGDYGNTKELAKLGDKDKEFFRIGVAKQLSDMLDDTRETHDFASKLILKPKFQKALRSVFPSDAEYEKFEKTLRNEVEFFKTKQKITGGSPTFQRAASSADATEPVISGHDLLSVAKQNYLGPAVNVGRKLHNNLSMMSPERAGEIGSVMLSKEAPFSAGQLSPSPLRKFMGNMTSIGGNMLSSSVTPAEVLAIEQAKHQNQLQYQGQ